MDTNLDEYFQKQKKFSGSVLIGKDNEIIFNKAYGYSNIEKGIKNTTQTKFMIGSITKPITALCIMQLLEKGMLSTKQSIEEYIPDFYKGKGITIHHLLNHTSGIPNYIMLRKQIKWEERHTPQEILEIVKSNKLKFPVGEKWSYCNTNYLILGLIIEIVSGMSYHQFVKENIFIPANMHSSCFISEEQAGLAENYINSEKGFYMDPTIFFACGDIVSTVDDLYLLDRAIRNEKLLKTQTAEQMEKSHHNGKYVKYGYGWFIKNHFYGKSVCHGGSVPNGYTSHFERYIDDDITIVVLSNDLVKYNILSMKEVGGTYISRELASIVHGKRLGIHQKVI